MKNFKTLIMIALFGAITYQAFSAYGYMTMTEAEKIMKENIKALMGDPQAPNDHPGCFATYCLKKCVDDNGKEWNWASREKCTCKECTD